MRKANNCIGKSNQNMGEMNGKLEELVYKGLMPTKY